MYRVDAIKQYLAESEKLEDWTKIEVVHLKGSPMVDWGTYTGIESFSVSISYTYDGKKGYTHWDEEEVIKFLEWFMEQEKEGS